MIVDHLLFDERVRYQKLKSKLESHLVKAPIGHRSSLDDGCQTCDALVAKMAPFILLSSERKCNMPETRLFNPFKNCRNEAELDKQYMVVVPGETRTAAALLLDAEYVSQRFRTIVGLQTSYFPNGKPDLRLLEGYALRKSELTKNRDLSSRWFGVASVCQDFGHHIN